MHKIGLIGLDTSHVSAFAKLLNDPANENHLQGARITVAFPGGSSDFALSRDRVEGFTKELREQHGVQILDSPEAVADACDLLFIESVDGRVHLEQFRRTVSYKKPTFIDKPLAVTLADAREIVRLTKAADVALMSCSSLRFAEGVQATLATGRDDIVGCDVFGPMNEEPTQPGLFWYGCHAVEMMVATMGPGCREVRCVRTDGHDLLTAVWGDGRLASLHGVRAAHWKFGITLHRKDRVEVIDCHAGKPYYVGLLTAILSSLPNHRSAVPTTEMIEVVAIIEAANSSRAKDGVPVALESP
jgi:predicted dehydrogenase